MLNGLLDAVNESVNTEMKQKARLEGSPLDGWILADFGDVILHLFSPERRKYYQLESLWSQGKILVHLQ
jgi:ribosome-associated protein